MARWMALDIGLKRIGVAITDPLCLFAQPYEVVSPDQLLDFLKKFQEKEGLSGLVIGLPLHLDGHMNDLEATIQKWIKTIQTVWPQLQIVRVDERFSSVMAGKAMHMAGATRKQKQEKGNYDKVSAAILLQTWLARPS